jgi:hypothetical protein
VSDINALLDILTRFEVRDLTHLHQQHKDPAFNRAPSRTAYPC